MSGPNVQHLRKTGTRHLMKVAGTGHLRKKLWQYTLSGGTGYVGVGVAATKAGALAALQAAALVPVVAYWPGAYALSQGIGSAYYGFWLGVHTFTLGTPLSGTVHSVTLLYYSLSQGDPGAFVVNAGIDGTTDAYSYSAAVAAPSGAISDQLVDGYKTVQLSSPVTLTNATQIRLFLYCVPYYTVAAPTSKNQLLGQAVGLGMA
jgi:hypothetical protein